ncbi:hypothetical protein BN9982_1790008 [Mycobacterium tuberculosis]|nr:hypothetical protein BN9982_1790008 [Mycobacterium tuberculosis]
MLRYSFSVAVAIAKGELAGGFRTPTLRVAAESTHLSHYWSCSRCRGDPRSHWLPDL